MNDRFKNQRKAHDHIVRCRSKELTRVFVPRWGYIYKPSEKLILAKLKRAVHDSNRIVVERLRRWIDECTMQRL